VKQRGRGLIINSITKFAWTDAGKPQQPSLSVFLVAAYNLTSPSAYRSENFTTCLTTFQLHCIQIYEFLGFLQIVFLQEGVRRQDNLLGKGSRTQATQRTNQETEIFLFSKTLRVPVGPQSFLCNGYRVSYIRIKADGAWIWLLTPICSQNSEYVGQ
jgi:hypothetical protein